MPESAPTMAGRWAVLAVYAATVGLFLWTTLQVHAAAIADACARNFRCARWLRPSFLFAGRAVDLADPQWRRFRGELPLLASVAALHCGASAYMRRRRPTRSSLVAFDCVSGALLVGFVHRANAAHLVVIALANYALCRACGAFRLRLLGRTCSLNVLASWAFLIAALLLRERREAVRFRALLGPSAAWLDASGAGWWDHLNLMALRMLSFNIDRAEAVSRHATADAAAAAAPASARADEPPLPTLRMPAAAASSALDGLECASLSPDAYGVWAYASYVFYAPLYIAGPVLTANSFLHMQARPALALEQPAARGARGSGWGAGAAAYGARWLLSLALMEWLSCRAPCFALGRALGDAGGRPVGAPRLTPAQVLGFSYLSLKLVWLKFLLIWRFFRLWASLDGRVPAENLPRCISTHYSILRFWRSWHASFNRWLLRYAYLPLGGRDHRWRNLWLIFTLVALWHEVEWRLLAWGWLIALFVAPEIGASALAARNPALRRAWYYRHLVAAGGAANIALLCAANLVGFGEAGAGGVAASLHSMATPAGAAAAAAGYAFLFVGVEIMIDLDGRAGLPQRGLGAGDKSEKGGV